MNTVPSLPSPELLVLGLACLCLIPCIKNWFVRQNKEIALKNNFLCLNDDEMALLRNAARNGTLPQLVAAIEISTELRTIAATVAIRKDRTSIVEEWYESHRLNEGDRARRLLAR